MKETHDRSFAEIGADGAKNNLAVSNKGRDVLIPDVSWRVPAMAALVEEEQVEPVQQ